MTVQNKISIAHQITGMTSTPDSLYIADSSSSIAVYNFPSSLNPSLQNTISVPEKIYEMRINGNALYCSGSAKLYVYSLVDPQQSRAK